MKTVEIFTDGACKGNPGPGGWGALLRMGRHEKELSGSEAETTNNRMEMTAVIRALEALVEPCEVHLHSDSRYVIDGMTKWINGWQQEWLDQCQQEAGAQCGLVARADRRRSGAPDQVDLGQGPRRPPGKRAGRPAGERGGGSRRRLAPIARREISYCLRPERRARSS